MIAPFYLIYGFHHFFLQVVGSSLFIIYDDHNVGVWLIDFAKTYPVPPGILLNHRKPWVQGNHEEGLLYGLDQLISVSVTIINNSVREVLDPLIE